MLAILDYGSQYSQLIARRIRECSVYSELMPHDISLEKLKALNPEGIILSGGPASVYEKDAPQLDSRILELGIPVLGICYGMQLIVKNLGGKVEQHPGKREYGTARINVLSFAKLFVGLPENFIVWMSHGDTCTSLPAGFQASAKTDNIEYAAIENRAKNIYGVQFHPEVVHTQCGMDIIKNFVLGICNAKPIWTMSNYIEEEVKRIREQVGQDNVLLGLSGGVDSTTVAALLHRAIGNQLTCMFIDQGFMRKHEAERIVSIITKYFDIKLIHINATKEFFAKMEGITDPEQKRKIIGNEFVATFEREAKKLAHFKFLAQGTLYPDVIESAVTGGTQAKTAVKIKTHHNVGGLPEKMNFKLVEPLRWLFKDEVRKLARELGVHEDLVNRQPFPGPGLAIRILGEVTPERVRVLQEADWIVIDEVKAAGLYNKLWQSFAVLLPVKSVGVMGDQRTYAYTCAVRCVTSEDAMTARWAEIPYDILEKISSRIVNEIPEINRVVYDITSKPPGTIEWE